MRYNTQFVTSETSSDDVMVVADSDEDLAQDERCTCPSCAWLGR